ncbi:MAG TPA: acyl-CoA desaturase [Polyangiales bacterium]|nr:acyl-CoA desaturase [Polyangiales bacterium]
MQEQAVSEHDVSLRAGKPNLIDLEARRIAAFGQAIDSLRHELESQLGAQDAEHIQRIGKLSQRLEVLGRSLIHFSFEPVSFGVGAAALWAHKTLELMEIGHMALHGAYDGLPGAERFQSQSFYWKAPIDEASWKLGHNVRHHQYTNIAGRDPDLDFGLMRLSLRIEHRHYHLLQPISNAVSWVWFTTMIGMHVSGMLDVLFDRGAFAPTLREALSRFVPKWSRYCGREYVFFPLLAGPFFAKVWFANLMTDVARDMWAGAIIYCGHVGADDHPQDAEPESRAHWYAMQVEAARDVDLPEWMSILSGALDLQIEHHLFPRMPPNRLREIAPRVRAICDAYGVKYRKDSWPGTLRSVFGELWRLRSQN